MGLHDRDYARSQGMHPYSGSLEGGSGRWSVNTWLIVICVAVFVLDGFFGRVPLETGYYWVHDPGTNAWVVDVADPTQFGRDRPEKLTLSSQWKEEKVRVFNGEDFSEEQIGGFPLLDHEGNVVAIAQGALVRPIEKWFHFSTRQVLGNAQIWRLVGFQFLHANMYHLLFNMIGLYFFGPLVERYLGGKRYLAFYLLCGIFGALFYLILNLGGYMATEVLGVSSVPGLLVNATGTPLIGASAGVFGVLMAGAFLAPKARVLLFFVIPMRLSTLAYGLVGISIASILINTRNAGGEAAHLGGAAAGWWFIRHPGSLHGLFDFAGRVDPTSKHFAVRGRTKPRVDSVDRILDKISREGLQSLTRKEKRILEEASRRDDAS